VQLARHLVLAVAMAAVLMLAVSGPGTRWGLWDWRTGLSMLRWALYAGGCAAVLALAFLAIPRTRGPRPSRLAIALLLGIVAGAPALGVLTRAKSLPFIHDVSTDLRDPPAFVSLAAERRASPNGIDHGGPEVASAQEKGYPDIRPLIVADAPARAFERALAAARAMGWQVAGADPAAGRIEATAVTPWFGFKDDVVVRVRSEGAGSRIDVRSVSRVGKSDVGANAARIRDYLGRLT
jgi:uncharacterized protein (DUF1499 family)